MMMTVMLADPSTMTMLTTMLMTIIIISLACICTQASGYCTTVCVINRKKKSS
eukprot:m.11116 g.11116  ORF g.11116 m.11116 type:complete len:53 (-) comp8661_c0_seq1:142-300(-)